MRELTQTVLGEAGNCWQTCVACILDVDPDTLPDQTTIERVTGRSEDGRILRVGSYNNPLQAYLRDHHAMTLGNLYGHMLDAVSVTSMSGLHLAFGPTVRTPSVDVDHVVVARDGVTIWDPHPTRAGLIRATSWGVFTGFPVEWDIINSRTRNPCVCAACTRAMR